MSVARKEEDFRRERAFTLILEGCKLLGWVCTTMADEDEKCRALVLGEKNYLESNFELAEVP